MGEGALWQAGGPGTVIGNVKVYPTTGGAGKAANTR